MLQLKQTGTFREWERNLNDRKTRAIIAARLFRLANDLPGDVSPVGEGVSELRIHYGPGYRIYFKQRGKEIIVLLCGGDKSTNAAISRLQNAWRTNGDYRWQTSFTTMILPTR